MSPSSWVPKNLLLPLAGQFLGQIEGVSKVFEPTLFAEIVLFGMFRSKVGCLEASKSSEKSQEIFLSWFGVHHKYLVT